jgi:glycosyltransferase involved in cell wall biosynthesis
MLVAHVSTLAHDSTHGANQTIRGLCRHLPTLNVRAERWHLDATATRVVQREIEGIRHVTLPCYRGMWASLRGLPHATSEYVASRAAEVDVLHLHSVFIPVYLSIARLCRRYVVTPHGGYVAAAAGYKRLAKSLWLTWRERRYLCHAAAVHAVSLQEMQRIQMIDPSIRVVCIPNGVDESLLQMPVEPPKSHQPWVYLGRLAVASKGLDLLLEGYAQVRREAGLAVPRLILAGGDYQRGRDQLEQMTRRLGIRESVEFTGLILGQTKWDLLASAGLLLLCSRWEGMPFVVLEALALGRPVLITPQTNLAAQVSRYNAGWVVETSASAIAAGLRAVLTCGSAELNQKSLAARRLAGECLTWPTIARSMLAVYRD